MVHGLSRSGTVRTPPGCKPPRGVQTHSKEEADAKGVRRTALELSANMSWLVNIVDLVEKIVQEIVQEHLEIM